MTIDKAIKEALGFFDMHPGSDDILVVYRHGKHYGYGSNHPRSSEAVVEVDAEGIHHIRRAAA